MSEAYFQSLRVAKLVEDITYRPGWNIYCVYKPEYDQIMLTVVANVLDSYGSGNMIDIACSSVMYAEFVSNIEDSTILSYIKNFLHKVEMHEADEWFTYKGERIFDPHKK